jgi:glycosyltransferase involved in cell wall biosynthesis
VLDLTGLILTFNEKENIATTLAALHWVPRIVVLDSFSTDETCEIVHRFPNARMEQRAFDSFAQQCNYGLSLIASPWVLSFDADYLCPPELAQEILQLIEDPHIAGYSAGFRYCVYGHPLRSTIYPDRVVLYRRLLALYQNEGHGHRVHIEGQIKGLTNKIDHDDRKPLSRWIMSQDAYARLEAHHLLLADPGKLTLADHLRLGIFYAPPIMFFYLLFVRGLILDVWRGWFYVMQRVVAECLLSLRLVTEKHALENNNFSAGDSP